MLMKQWMAGALLTLSCLSAHAAGTNLTIRSNAGGDQFCMDARGDRKGNGTEVFMYKCHGHENQRWTITATENNQAAIVGTGGFCLDVKGRHSRNDGTPVQLWKCHFGANQRFNITPDGKIREVESGKCLMALGEQDGAPIILDQCQNTSWEQWHFE